MKRPNFDLNAQVCYEKKIHRGEIYVHKYIHAKEPRFWLGLENCATSCNMLQKWPAKLKKVKKVITSGKEQKAKDIIFLFLLGGDNINQG